MLCVLLHKRLARRVPTFSFAILVASLALLPVARMQERIADIRAGTANELVWLVEHPPLYTAGTSAPTHTATAS